MGQRNAESTAKSVLLIFKVAVIVFLVPSALSQKNQEKSKIKQLFDCAAGRLPLIKEAEFSETTSLKLCDRDGNSSYAQEKMDIANCSECFSPYQQQKCVARFSLQFLSEIYFAADSRNKTLQNRVADKVNRGDQRHTIGFQCVNVRKAALDPCEKKKINSTQIHTIAIFPLWPREPQSCKSKCMVQLHDTNEVYWESQFLLRNGASAEDNAVFYQIRTSTESLNWTRMNNPHLKKTKKKIRDRIQRIWLQFRIKDVLDVSRFWINFTGTKVNKIECTTINDDNKIKDDSASDSEESEDDDDGDDGGGGSDDETNDDDCITTEALPLESSTPDGLSGSGTSGEQHNHGNKKQYWRYLFAIPAVLAFLAVVICILILVWKKSDNQPSRNPETSHMLQTAPKSGHRTTNDNPQNRYGRFQNEAYSHSFDATDAAQPSRRAFPPLVGHVTGSGSDDRQYGTLDHHEEGNRRWRGEEDDYNHVLLPGSEGDYESCQRETGRRIVIDNPYDHTS